MKPNHARDLLGVPIFAAMFAGALAGYLAGFGWLTVAACLGLAWVGLKVRKALR